MPIRIVPVTVLVIYFLRSKPSGKSYTVEENAAFTRSAQTLMGETRRQ